MYDAVFCFHLLHMRAFQHLQETKLKLLRSESIYIIERPAEAFIILKGKSCDQIQVLMDISEAVNPIHNCR